MPNIAGTAVLMGKSPIQPCLCSTVLTILSRPNLSLDTYRSSNRILVYPLLLGYNHSFDVAFIPQCRRPDEEVCKYCLAVLCLGGRKYDRAAGVSVKGCTEILHLLLGSYGLLWSYHHFAA
jgi:hypothetical protein